MNIFSIKNVFVADSMYSLLEYLLYQSEADILHTYYFWSYGVSDEVKNYFANQSSTIEKGTYTLTQRLKLYHLHFPIRWPFLLFPWVKYYGVDHLCYSAFILRNHKYTLLEDGLLNYTFNHNKSAVKNSHPLLNKFLYGNITYATGYTGSGKYCKEMLLTGMAEGEIMKDKRVKRVSLRNLWKKSSHDKQSLIKEIFGLSDSFIENLKGRKVILVTQPLSEYDVISENDKINIYRGIMKRFEESDVVVKPHPMEKTDYCNIFPNATIVKERFPLELLSYAGIRFDIAATIYSSAVFDFDYDVKVLYLGTGCHPVMAKRLPELQFSVIAESKTEINFIH